MARTALFTRVQCLLREQRSARANRLSVAQMRDLRVQHAAQKPGLDSKRRAFLTLAGAAAAVTLLPKPLRAALPEPRIAIVGAGIAGLSCALKLADHGIHANEREFLTPRA